MASKKAAAKKTEEAPATPEAPKAEKAAKKEKTYKVVTNNILYRGRWYAIGEEVAIAAEDLASFAGVVE